MLQNPYETFPLTIISVTPQTDIDWTFRVASDLTPESGQFLQLSIPGIGEAPISISDFGDGWLEMTIRKVGTLTNRIFEMSRGDTLFARGPYGNGFKKEIYKGCNLLIVAGGTGVAPVKSLISYFCRNRSEIGQFDLIIGFRSPGDVLFRDEISEWAKQANVILTVDKADDSWKSNTGLVTAYIDKYVLPKGINRVITVGPPIMMKFATLSLLKRGYAEEVIDLSFERKMSCGIGKCGHCKIDETYVCLEGPVFNYTKAAQLLD